jgi:predicted nucleic acid-binding protein
VIYFDTSYLAKCYLNEPGAEKVRAIAERAEGLCSCELARAEFFATIHRHFREGRLKRAQMKRVLSLFEGDEADGVWAWFAVTSELVRSVCESIRALPATTFIRSADALHLKCAYEHGHRELYSNDRHMIAAGPRFQMNVRNVIE